MQQPHDSLAPQTIAADIVKNASTIIQLWNEEATLFIEPLMGLDPMARTQPIVALLTAIGEASRLADRPQRLMKNSHLGAGTRHGQLRAAVGDYADCYLNEEYSLLRLAILEHWRGQHITLSRGTMWVHRQLDLMCSAALTAFEAVRNQQMLIPPITPSSTGFGLVLGGYGDPIWEYDVRTGNVQWSQELVGAWGYAPECCYGPWQWWLDRIHPGDQARIVDEQQAHAAAQIPSGTYCYRFARADGVWVDVRHRVYRKFDTLGGAQRCVGMLVAVDQPLLTKDKITGDTISRVRPNPAEVEPLPSSIVLVDLERRFVYANQALLDYWDCTLETLRGQRLEDRVGASFYAFMQHYGARALSGHFVSFEMPFRSPQGEARWHQLSYLPYRDANNVVQGVVAHVIDLQLFVDAGPSESSYHRFSRQYQALLSELQQVLHAPTAAVIANAKAAALIADLENQRQARERFVAMLAHDLRNPLAAARMTAERLIRRIGSENSVVTSLATRLCNHIDRTDQLVGNLLDTSGIENGKALEVVREPMDLGATVVEVINDFVPAHGRIVFVPPTSAIHGEWGIVPVRRILENLLSNAVKYGDAKKPITVTLKDSPTGPRLSVHNWGDPIPKNNREDLFRPFVRAPSAVRSGQPGWGVGLALVRALVEAHGGTVTVHSTTQQGTAFDVTLPR